MSSVHQEETAVILIKDTCSLANHLSAISDVCAIPVCCLPLNSWWPLPFYFLQINTQPAFLLNAWGLLISMESTVSVVFLSRSTRLPGAGFSDHQVQSWIWHDVSLIPFLSKLCSCGHWGCSPAFLLFQKQELCGSSAVQDAVMPLVSIHMDSIVAAAHLINVDIKHCLVIQA